MRCTRISRLRLWKPSNFDFDLRWPLTAPIRVHSFAADDDDDAAADSISGIRPRRCTRTNGPERAVENRKKHEFHAVHSCRSHTHFRESQGELRRGAELRDTIQGPDGCPLSSSGLIRIMWPRLLYQYLIMTFCRFTSGGLERNGRDHRDSCFAKNPPFLTRILPVLSPFHSSSILHYVNCSISMQI